MASKTLSSSISFDDIFSRLLFTAVALELAAEDGDADVSGLAAPLNKILTRWEELDHDRKGQQRALIRANVQCKRGNLHLDAALTAVNNATLATVDQNRKDPVFTHLFPKPLSTLIRPALEGQLKIADSFIERLKSGIVPAALRKAHEKPLRDSITRGEAASKSRVTTQAAGAALSSRIDALWTDANAALQHVEGALKQIAAKQGLGKDWIDSFFPDVRVGGTKKKPAEGSGAAAPVR